MARIMSPDDVTRATTRIAHEISERNHGTEGLVILGIPTRGVPLAHRIAAALEAIDQATVPSGSIDIGMYRDDIDTRPRTPIGPTEIPTSINDAVVVLVDDVLYTGRTIRAALDALADIGRPSAVQLAVMVDRGHRQLPIRPDYVGKNVPTSLDDHVSVRFTETDDVDGVWAGTGGEA
jgi:pyrimidine operon attenuation protein/uracil phosphoribosyltransferase